MRARAAASRLVLVFWLAGAVQCGTTRESATSDADVDLLRGTATYRERMALPAGAVLEATLEDVSRADAPAEVLGRTRIETPGNPPIPFEIRYDASRIDPSRRYAVRARILVADEPLFVTDTSHPVLTTGERDGVALVLRRVQTRGDAARSLEGTTWTLIQLGDAPVRGASPRAQAHLVFDPATRRVSGSGGCNRITGGYERSGDRLQLREVAGTMMACAENMETERAFLNSLGKVGAWRIRERRLELLDAAGNVLARFEPGGVE